MATQVQKAIADAVAIDRDHGRAAALDWCANNGWLRVATVDQLTTELDRYAQLAFDEKGDDQ